MGLTGYGLQILGGVITCAVILGAYLLFTVFVKKTGFRYHVDKYQSRMTDKNTTIHRVVLFMAPIVLVAMVAFFALRP
jgi:heme/copper-type cytochrome/quinol oxidase subunit 2